MKVRIEGDCFPVDIEKNDLLFELRDEITTGKDVAFHMINEAGLSRLLQRIAQDNNDFAIITAYRFDYTKKDNVLRNRHLRGMLNDRNLGVYPVVGHWQECQLKDDEGNPIPYNKCPKDQLEDVVERSYVVVRSGMSPEEFFNLMMKLGSEYDQDGVLMRFNDEMGIFNPRSGKIEFKLGNEIVLGKIAQAYSQYIKKLNVPFVFEGLEIPNGPAQGKKAFYEMGFRWI